MRTSSFALLLLGLAAPAIAGDSVTLNGIWQGSYTCKTEDADGKGTLKVTESVLTISQGAITSAFNADIDGVPYSGTTVASAPNDADGAGAWIACGTSDATAGGLFNEIETFHYQVDPSGGGTIKKSGAYVQNGVEIGVCKGSWKRVSTGLVKVGGCAP